MSNFPLCERATVEMYEYAWLGTQAEQQPEQFIEFASQQHLRDPENYPAELIDLGNKLSWEIALGHVGLANTVANRFKKAGEHPTLGSDDLSSVGLLGIFESAGKYYPKRDFLTPGGYFYKSALFAVYNYARDFSTTVRLPGEVRSTLRRLDKLSHHRDSETGVGIGPRRAFEIVGVTSAKTRKRLEQARLITKEIGSLDTGFSPDIDDPSDNRYSSAMEPVYQLSPNNPIENTVNTIRDQEIQQALDKSNLTVREKAILRQRCGLGDEQPKTLEEIGEHFGITRERVRVIESEALKKLRRPNNINLFSEVVYYPVERTYWDYIDGQRVQRIETVVEQDRIIE